MSSQPREIINRLCSALNVSTLAGLSRFLDVSPQAINGAIRKQQIPDVWLYKVSYHTGRLVEWLRSGTGLEFADAVTETERRYGLIEAEALRVFLTRRLDLKDDQQHLIDHALRLLIETDNETRELMVALLRKIAKQPAVQRRQRGSALSKKAADSA